MIRRAALALALAGAGSPVLGAEGGVIRGGEHDDFSRIVMTVEPTTEWSLETGARAVTIRFPGRRLAFDAGTVFARMPTTRIQAVSVGAEAGDTVVQVTLGCDCRVSTAFVGAQYLALDVADPGGPRPVAVAMETPEQRTRREATVVATAEEILIRQIERAAGQGIVELSDGDEAPAAVEPEAQVALRREPAPLSRPAERPEAAPETGIEAEVAAVLLDQDQVEATTVYDRDSARARATAPVAEACLPDSALDVAAWTNGQPFPAQLAPLRRGLVGEFDAPEAANVRDLARLYVRFGFGAEARAVIEGFGDESLAGDAGLLADLARVVDGEPAAEGGPLASDATCPGLHGLWLALGGRAPAYVGAAQFEVVHAGFEGLPPDLRGLVGPTLVGRLLDAGRPAEARVILDTLTRSGAPVDPDPAVAVAAGRVLAAEGRTGEAIATLVAVADARGPLAGEALVALAKTALAARIPVPERTILDLRAAALLARGTEAEAGLRALLAEVLAARAELPAAIAETRAAMADLPDSAATFGGIAVASLAAADPAAVGAVAYAETVLAAGDLLAGAPPRDPARRRVAAHLVALGLPKPALAVLAPALVLDDPAARLIAAEAEIGLGDAEAARTTLAGIGGDAAAVLMARSYRIDGNYGEAVAALKAAGLDAEAAAYAWPSGDWARVDAADPEQAALAGFMAGRPEGALGAPLPALERPSLAAARTLLESGPEIGGFIGGVLANEAPAPDR